MKKINSLKSKVEFSEILNSGVKLRSKYFLISFLKDDNINFTKIGISIPKKIGNAVLRNRNKRQIKNILSEIDFFVNKNLKIVLIVKKDFIDLTFNQKMQILKKELLKTLRNGK